MSPIPKDEISLLISRSSISTRINKTGSWRYVRPIYDEKTAPCSSACPAGEDIPRIEMLMSQGRHQDALETILVENPFPAVCGHVCFHPCEDKCNRSFFDEPVAIHHIERHIGILAAQGVISASIQMNPPNNKRVCVVGAGPSGLAAAYFLRCLGFECDVFEAEASAGGLLCHGIPAYRLPAGIVEREVARIIGLGVRCHFGKRLSKDFLDKARETYHAMVIACGNAHAVSLKIPGENLSTDGLAFLRGLRNGNPPGINGAAAVVGGGNTAVDVARSLIRLGAAPIIVYRRRQVDMPAFADEIQLAKDEGVQFRELAVPVHMESDGRDILVTLQGMKVAPGKTKDGRAQVVPSEQPHDLLRVQHVFTAIGAEPDAAWYLPGKTNEGIVGLHHCTMVLNGLPVVYGGDLVNRFQSVADAVASGKAAAMAIDTYFNEGAAQIENRMSDCRIGKGPALSMAAYAAKEFRPRNPQTVSYADINIDYFSYTPRFEPDTMPPVERIRSFTNVVEDFSPVEAREQAERCFNCGICNACGNCVLFCPEAAVRVEGVRIIDMDYCKGCGVCVEECPRSAMSLEEERHEANY